MANFAGKGDVPATPGQRQPRGGHHGRQGDDEDRVGHLKPASRDFKRFAERNHPLREPVGENVQRRTRLFKPRPEHRRGDEQHDDHPKALLFGVVEVREKEQHREVNDGDGDDEVGGVTGQRVRVEVQDAGQDEQVEGRDHPAGNGHDSPVAPMVAPRLMPM